MEAKIHVKNLGGVDWFSLDSGTEQLNPSHGVVFSESGLLENFGELRKQVVAMDHDYKRGGENSDQTVFPLRKQLEDFEQRLTKFIEEMTQVAFESNLKIRGNSDQISALWDALETVTTDTDEVKRQRKEVETREEVRQAPRSEA